MFDIMDFFDSEDIRRCNQQRKFTPIEQAVLIYVSEKKTTSQKLSAWKELVETYSAEEFQQGQVGRLTGTEVSFKQILLDTICQQERALTYTEYVEGAVFCVRMVDMGYEDDKRNEHYFSCYTKAYDFLKRMKYEAKDMNAYGIIELHWLDEKREKGHIVYQFDSELQLMKISIEEPELWRKENLESFYVHVEVPFQKGDILRSVFPCRNGERLYGILSSDPDEERFLQLSLTRGEMVDMSLTLHTFQEENAIFSHEHFSTLLLERCPAEELPEGQKILEQLHLVYQGNLNYGTFLELYSRYGKDMPLR